MVEIPYKAILEQSSLAFVFIDSAHNILAMNDACLSLLGLESVPHGQSVFELIAPSLRAVCASHMAAVLDGTEPSVAKMMLTTDQRVCSYHMTVINDPSLGACLCMQIQDQQQYHEALVSLRQERLKAYFLLGLHGRFEHQVNASLHAALGMLSLQFAGKFEPGDNKALDLVQRSCEEVRDLLRGQRNLHASMGSYSHAQDHDDIEIEQIVLAALYVFQHQSCYKHIRIHRNIQQTQMQPIDSLSVFMVVFSVIEYALTHATTQLEVDLTMSTDGSMQVRVHCDASDLNPELSADLFLPYVHDDSEQLGLFIAQQTAVKLSASLSVQPREEALTFFMEFPKTV